MAKLGEEKCSGREGAFGWVSVYGLPKLTLRKTKRVPPRLRSRMDTCFMSSDRIVDL